MLLHRAEEILNLTDRTVCELSSSELGQEGILSLGVVPSMSLMVLPQMIAAFKELYPKITYRLLIGESLRVIELLEKGVIELLSFICLWTRIILQAISCQLNAWH